MGDVGAPGTAEVLLEHLFRRQAGRIVAYLVRVFGTAHLDLAEDAVQEAMVRAMQAWPFRGIPEKPEQWLFRAAYNVAVDALRRSRRVTELPEELVQPEVVVDLDFEESLRDDELRMIFMCCRPELSPVSRVALSLKTVGGFSVREIARAFLADDATIAQRLVRAKRVIRELELTLEMPEGEELQRRLDSVLEVIYFVFNEGYGAHEGEDLIRQDLCFEALRLGRLISGSSICMPRVHALVALMALQAQRLPARINESGDLVLLEDQDRSKWDPDLKSLGFHHYRLAMAGDDVSEYHVQAAIAATHSHTPVDWIFILEMYDRLHSMNPSSIVALNRAVAISKVFGASRGLAALEGLELDGYFLFLAVRGHLLLELGELGLAADSFRAALECRCSEPERRFLSRKLADCCLSG